MASLPFSITELQRTRPSILVIGNQTPIVQSILDFDFLCGRAPSISAIIGGNRKYQRFFFGEKEIILPVYIDASKIPLPLLNEITYVVNLSSGRRVLSSSLSAAALLPNLKVLAVFAEAVPEQHALELRSQMQQQNVTAIGPATVGLLIPGLLKLGAIGGTDHRQILQSRLNEGGSVAIMSSSGGMTNELINIVSQNNHGVSFAVSFGGERFPLLKPAEAFLAAEEDTSTHAIVYFGELGGTDEYVLADLLKNGRITKPVVAYIAGRIAELFESPPQFGHAKAIARTASESASAKQAALRDAGAIVAQTFGEFIQAIADLPRSSNASSDKNILPIRERTPALFVSSIAKTDESGELTLVGKTLPELAEDKYGRIVTSILLGHQPVSAHTEQLVELILKLLVDHGPNVSGAVNTMITASAGRDLVSALAAGLLTIGPRFGGAVNGSADVLLRGVTEGIEPRTLVEEMAQSKQLIPGIGHKKYRLGLPDPRVELVLMSLPPLEDGFITYARAIESITTSKNGSLILNVDGIIAASLLDVLHTYEGYGYDRLRELVDIEFFNAFFVAARTVGFIGHYLDQRKLDHGLFRLDDKYIGSVDL